MLPIVLAQDTPVEQQTINHPFVQRHAWTVVVVLGLFVAAAVPAGVIYARYYRLVTRTLNRGAFSNTSNIFAAPRLLTTGEEISPESIVKGLERAGYTPSSQNPKGWFRLAKNALEVHPGRQSYFAADPVIVDFSKGSIAEMRTLESHERVATYQLEPELIANIAEKDREKRRLVKYHEIPAVLVQAVVSAEDKRFFNHLGIDPLRLAKAAYVDLKYHRKQQGASTITMQLARSFWLDKKKRFRRKFSELMITMVLEQRLTKEQIFENYANQVYLGRNDSFSIHGFGEASRAYFGKRISELTLPEAALLAGLIQRPSYFNPERYPERAKYRRDVVLRLMKQNGYITAAQFAEATRTPIRLAPPRVESSDAPFFVALLNDELQNRLGDEQGTTGALNVYSTLDPDLQRAASEAVHAAMPKVDAYVRRHRIAKDGVLPQVALVAIDPHTGEVKALIGGRDYQASQLNHALALRQPGSVFKPFVYAAALSSAVQGGNAIYTPASTIVDEPTTIQFGDQIYQPSNFEHRFYGRVTLRQALAKSMNLATVKLAGEVGYDRVVRTARRCGLNNQIQPTPAVALGAYETTPLEMAGAYTVFANRGEYVKPTFLSHVSSDGQTLLSGSPDRHRALDPRVAFLMQDMLKEVMRSGTAAGVRSQGFRLPAAGKTGTSRDGWFAGYTPNLLCVIWVGFDDNRELDMEGAKSALPVWAEFMKRAAKIHPAKRSFDPPPPGVVAVGIDPWSGLLTGPGCDSRQEYFIDGTQPHTQCTPLPPVDPMLGMQPGWPPILTNAAAQIVIPTAGPSQ